MQVDAPPMHVSASLSLGSSLEAPRARPLRQEACEPAPDRWQALPLELRRQVVLRLDDPGAEMFAQVDRAARALVQGEGRTLSLHHDLLAQSWRTPGEALLALLERQRGVMRGRRTPWVLFEASPELLQGVARLTQGSAQRPVALFDRARPKDSWPVVPEGMQAADELAYLRGRVPTLERYLQDHGDARPIRSDGPTSLRAQLDEQQFFDWLRLVCGYLNLPQTPSGRARQQALTTWLRSWHKDPDAARRRLHRARARCLMEASEALCPGLWTKLCPTPRDATPQTSTLMADDILMRAAAQLVQSVPDDIIAWRADVVSDLEGACASAAGAAPEAMARAQALLDGFIHFARASEASA